MKNNFLFVISFVSCSINPMEHAQPSTKAHAHTENPEFFEGFSGDYTASLPNAILHTPSQQQHTPHLYQTSWAAHTLISQYFSEEAGSFNEAEILFGEDAQENTYRTSNESSHYASETELTTTEQPRHAIRIKNNNRAQQKKPKAVDSVIAQARAYHKHIVQAQQTHEYVFPSTDSYDTPFSLSPLDIKKEYITRLPQTHKQSLLTQELHQPTSSSH